MDIAQQQLRERAMHYRRLATLITDAQTLAALAALEAECEALAAQASSDAKQEEAIGV